MPRDPQITVCLLNREVQSRSTQQKAKDLSVWKRTIDVAEAFRPADLAAFLRHWRRGFVRKRTDDAALRGGRWRTTPAM